MNTTHAPLTIPELLAPAGNFDKLKIAIHYGADAVYLGGPCYSLRAHATFTEAELQRAIAYAHAHAVKAYVTVNILAHDQDLAGLNEYLLALQEMGLDGLIISDPGILAVAKETIPAIPVHLSTQANVTNSATGRFWQQQGVRRLNIARELTLAEIKTMRKKLDIEIEAFVHGALCISYSGRCLLSYYLTGRDANRGNCAHPCRYHYTLVEEKRPGQYFPVEEDARGTYIFNSKDLCLLNRLPDLVRAGVDSLKIEGRMKSPYYVGGVVRVYRAALDYLAQHVNALAQPTQQVVIPKEYMEELMKVGTRGYTENFIDGPPDAKDMLYDAPRIPPGHVPMGIVRQAGEEPLIEIRNPVRPGEQFEYLGRGLQTSSYTIGQILDQKGASLKQANPGNEVRLKISPPLSGWEENALLRKQAS